MTELREPIGRSHRYWLTLIVGIWLPLLVFSVLAVTVGWYGDGFLWEIPILQAVHATVQPELDGFARTLTKFGVFWGVFPVAIVTGLVLLYQRRWRSLLYVAITLFSNIVINRTAKIFFHRVRPHLWEVPLPEPDYSFPSGHAMSSMTLVVVLVALMWSTRWCGWVLVGGSVFVVAIAWTRLYLGVHYPSDILAGWMLSLAWAVGANLLIQPQQPSTDTPVESNSPEFP
ncbi:MAG: phosphatase PAP2 family protein [Stenomitos rutilans HA7619-LM2]|jgi:undecaprenyl-diphosphatase|nr:phosphatase PAP2 family protein [Stenomitos rutilans HA7619-LM2]